MRSLGNGCSHTRQCLWPPCCCSGLLGLGLPLPDPSSSDSGSGTMLLDADQMALVPWELPLPSLAFLAAGSGGRGLTFSWLSAARGWLKLLYWLGPIPIVVLGAGWRSVLPQTCSLLFRVPHICLAVSWGGSCCSWG